MSDTLGVDIDLYADVEDFNNDDAEAVDIDEDSRKARDLNASRDRDRDKAENGDSGGKREEEDDTDLYDDVIASTSDMSVKREENKSIDAGGRMDHGSGRDGGGAQYPVRRHSVYVGNLTWWTTDQDIQDAVVALDIEDFLEVKFYENRVNGQSKGFCCVTLGSEKSMRKVLEELPKKEMHSQMPAVTMPSRQALNQFESQSKTRPVSGGGGGQGGGPPPPSSSREYRPPPPLMGGGGGGGNGGAHHSYRDNRGPPPPHQQAPYHSSSSYGRPPPFVPPMHGRGPPPPAPVHHMGIPPPGPPPMHHHHPHLFAPAQGPLPVPHVNPAFMPHPGVAPGYALPLAPAPGIAPIPLGISEREFDDIMARNRTVSSSAIARAVQDAASGEFGSAIETLVTAISLIKQSKVAGDDRCRILVTSLQDTLQGIENKSYSKSHRRERSRERSPRHPSFSRERERDYPPRERDHYQSSRERENYYRERSPRREEYRSGGGGGGGSGSRDKYYESDRYRREGESSSSRPKREEIMDRDRH